MAFSFIEDLSILTALKCSQISSAKSQIKEKDGKSFRDSRLQKLLLKVLMNRGKGEEEICILNS